MEPQKPSNRVKSVIHFQETDRTPVIPELIAVTATIAGVSPREYVRSGKTMAECQIAAQKRIGHDAVFAMADLCVEAEALGCELFFPEDNYPYVKSTILNKYEDLKKLKVPDPMSDGRMPELLKAVRLMKKSLGNSVPVIAHVTGPITLASRIMDIEKMLYMIVDDPDRFKNILEFCLAVSHTFAKQLAREGADGIIVFDPSASPSVLPKRIFKEFELPVLRRIFNSLKEDRPESITWYSVAGPLQTNFAILNSVASDISTVDYMVPIETAMKYSATTVINGNIKPALFLEGGKDDIMKEANSLLVATRSLERFILGSGCEVPLYSKVENIAALVEAAEREREIVKNLNAPAKGLHEITIMPYKRKIHVASGSNLLETIQKANIGVTSYCHKSGSCGKCVVRVKSGTLSMPKKIEKLQLENIHNHPDDRLACQVTVQGPMEIYIPQQSRIFKRHTAVPAELYKTSLDEELAQKGFFPNIAVKPIDIEKIKGMPPESYAEWAKENFSSLRVSHQVLNKLRPMARNGNNSANAVVDITLNEIVDFSCSNQLYGLAVDIGTTTISAYLHDLATGELKAIGMTDNNQNQWGLDVITRAANTIVDPSLLKVMQEKLIEDINSIISNFHRNYSIPNHQIYDMVIVANPVITHFFLGLSPESLSKAPFTPLISDWVSTSSEDMSLGQALAVNNRCRIEILPSIGGFVGSDIVAGILATDMHNREEISLFVDIGTNGEIVIGNRDKMLSTSVAAGPAFEGAHLSHGRTFQNGIIHKVGIDGDKNIHYETLGKAAPIGLCGSAVIDALACFRRNGIIDNRGRFTNIDRWPQIKENVFILVPKQKTAIFSPISISSMDIEEIQKAKSAIRTGIDLLIREMEIAPEKITNVFISGSFGIFIDIQNAKTIGMIPDFPWAKFHFIKNSAGIGSRLALLSQNARREAREIVAITRHINLAHHDSFNDLFIDNMFFPEFT